MSESPKCQQPGCGLLMIYEAPFPQGRGISGRFVCPRNADAHALCAQNKKLRALLKEARMTFEMWKDVAPAVSLCADIDRLLAKEVP